MVAKCPNGCSNPAFIVAVEVPMLYTISVSSTGELYDVLDRESLEAPNPFSNNEWECSDCGAPAEFDSGKSG